MFSRWGVKEELVFSGNRVLVLQDEKALEICFTPKLMYLTWKNLHLKVVKMVHSMSCVFFTTIKNERLREK